ncbi:MAG TPA: hypothetical protein VFX38_07275 [Gammaproteobacteria bacterium]|nr:hypothetical protein [Gammaproteobacteria bacterium]
MNDAALERLREWEGLTRDYARFSRSAGGLGSALGGVLTLVSYFAGALLPSDSAARLGLIAIPFVWLLVRGALARRYYQRFGHVEEQESTAQRRTHRFCVAVTLLVAAGITAVTAGEVTTKTGADLAGLIGYLALIWFLVLATWRWLRSPLDFIVGVFLFCQAALICVGRSYPLIWLTHTREALLMSLIAAMFPLAALAMIAAGIGDHRRFLRLRTRLAELQRTAVNRS